MANKTAKQLEEQIHAWNVHVPVGTEVEYHPVIDRPEHQIHRTRSQASLLSDHTAVVFLEGKSGCVALDACRMKREVEV